MSDERAAGARGERLHRAAIAVYAVRALRDGALPLLVVLGISIAGQGVDAQALWRGVAFAVLGTAGAAIAGLIRWSSTTYAIGDDVVHLRAGWLSVKETDIPIGRVQAIDTQQGPVQRLFGVQSVSVQTGGGGAGGEIVLDALGAAELARLREAIAARTPAPLAAEREALPERRLGRGGLLAAALTSGQLGVILPALAGLSQMFENALGDPSEGEQAIRLLPHSAGGWVLAVAGLVALAWLLSVLGAIVAFAGFRVARERDRLRIRRGLVQRREVTLPVARVRAVTVVEGVLRQPFGLAAVRVEVIGYAKEPAAAQTLFPLLRRSEVPGLLDELLPELADRLDGLAPPPPRALRRYLLAPALAGLAAGAAGCLVIAPWPLLAAPAGAGYGWLRWRAAGWRLERGRLAVSTRLLARRTVLAPAAGRESHALAQSVLQRRAELADLEVAFGKRTTARIRHLDAGVASAAWVDLRVT